MKTILVLLVSFSLFAFAVACSSVQTETPTVIPVLTPVGAATAFSTPLSIPTLASTPSRMPTARPQGTPTLATTPKAAQTPVAISPPVLLGEGVGVAEDGVYVVEVATRKLWWLGDGFSNVRWSPDGKTLARAVSGAMGRGNLEIDLIDLETASATRIVSGGMMVAWSPDGNQIAFTKLPQHVSGRVDIGALYVINRDGSGERQIAETDKGEITSTEWSPRGDRIAFQISDRGVYLLHLPSGEITELAGITNPMRGRLRFAWSPDGRSIAFDNPDGFYLYDVDTGSRRRVMAEQTQGIIQWSPDGSKLLILELTEQQSHSYRAFVVDAKALGEPQQVAEAYESPSWSPDGQRIAYISDGCTSREWDIHIVGIDGASPKRLTNTPKTRKGRVSWSPTEPTIAFSSVSIPTESTNSLMLVNSNTGGISTLTTRDGSLRGEPMRLSAWSADGRYISFFVGFGGGVCD